MNNSSREMEAAAARREFVARFGAEPTHVVWAPGRVNLIGEHTDYNDGFVLPMATEAGLVLAARPRADRIAHVESRLLGESFRLALDEPIAMALPKWSLYVRGVLAGLLARGLELPGFDALISGNLPAGGGLSSSAALEVATATLGESLAGAALDPLAKALVCLEAEQQFAGVPCGIMDQFAVIFSQPDHLLLVDCRSRSRELVPLANDEVTVLIVNSMVRHELTGGEYAARRQQCQEAARVLGVASLRDVTAEQVVAAEARLRGVLYHRARHVTTENDRTLAASRAIRRGDWPAVGALMYESHESLRRDYEVSCDELDLLVSLARDLGAFGCRMTGGGFGGCVVALVRTPDAARCRDVFCAEYERRTGIAPEVLASRPAGGAAVLQES